MTPIHCYSQPVNFPDIDAGGGMFHGRYLDYYDRARHSFFLSHGINLHALLLSDIALVVVEANVRYARPILLLDELYIYSEAKKSSTKCVMFSQVMFTASADDIPDLKGITDSSKAKNIASISLVSVNLKNKKVVSLPEAIQDIFK
jgi:YbgC/YbaW family acyl-CoA thioester hydrolase